MRTKTIMNRRQFTKILMTVAGTTVFAPFNILRAQASKLKIGVLLPKSGVQGLIGQSCQKGADLAPRVIRELLGVEIELMNADTETNVDTARTREAEILELVAQGQANKEIAATLGISERTARTHVSHVLRKLDVSSRTQAALLVNRADSS